MSTQLILYPQYYQGFSSTSSTYNQFVVNGSYFTGLNSTDLHNTAYSLPYVDAMYSQPPSTVNTWYRFTTVGGGATWGAVAAPQSALNDLLLSYNGSTAGHTGVYQQMSGLVVGADYDILIDISVSAVGTLMVRVFGGASSTTTSTASFSSNVSSITHTFTAVNTNQTILIDYTSTTASLLIDSIKCVEGGQSPTLTYTDLQDGQVICDLYQEEDIPLSLSVDNFKNVAEKVQSYSKDFNLPATKRNNQIFDNVFEITRTDTGINFNPYVKTKCVLKQDGYILFDGYLRLINIKDKEGEISYDVNLYSEVVALADILKDKKFADLDFTELTHDYDKSNIKRSWNDSPDPSISYTNPSTSGFRDTYTTLRYPFVDWTHQYPLDATTGYPILPNLESSFRPFIKIKYLIERIFADTPFSFTSDFFDSADFGKLYMDFNWGSTPEFIVGGANYFQANEPDNNSTTSFTNLVLQDTFTAGASTFGWDNATNRLVASTTNQTFSIDYTFNLTKDGTSGTINLQWIHSDSFGNVITTFNPILDVIGTAGIYTYDGSFQLVMNTGDYLEAQFKSSTAGMISQSTVNSYCNMSTGGLIITTGALLQNLRGELGQWDFLKGLMTMFNLVTMPDPDNPNNILIEPYADVFINNTNCSTTTGNVTLACRSIQHDWTDKVDVSEMKLTPLTDLNKKTVFKFVEDEDDYAFNVYKNSVGGFLYGSKNYDASGFTILEGEDEIIAEPFAATIPKPLDALFSNFIVPAIYSMTEDGTSEGFENSPRIMYNNGIKDTGITYFIPAQNGLSNENQSNFLQFSHLTDIPTIVSSPPVDTDTRDFHFGECQLINPIGDATVNNLYNIYWSPYYDELYNADTRIMTLKVNLSPADINTFKFNDKVFIKNRVFRVNKIDYKPNDLATVEFILIP
jgi:hypothetical protein